MMRRPWIILLAAACALVTGSASAGSRIKDLTIVEGARDNQLVGYGLVVGLAGQGDSNQALFTAQSVANALQRFGVSVPASTIRAENVAAVMVTANIEAFSKAGNRIDVLISAIGDAESLQGGVLLQTPLLGADDQVYAVAQGPLAVGGFLGGGGGASVQRNHPTVGTISNGAIVEREIETSIAHDGAVNFLLRNSDYASAVRMAEAINEHFNGAAVALSPTTVQVEVPEPYRGREVVFIASVGAIEIQPDVVARVVLNERTGTIVATSNVRLSEVAISHGNLNITIRRTPVISQPPALSNGSTVVAQATDVEVVEVDGGFSHIGEMPTLDELTNALNSLGVSTRDMMAIFQAMKRAGALQAELVIN